MACNEILRNYNMDSVENKNKNKNNLYPPKKSNEK